MHFYHSGESCICGQVPVSVFFAQQCDCGAQRQRYALHKIECAYICWGKKRNEWIDAHPEVSPPVEKIVLRLAEVPHGK